MGAPNYPLAYLLTWTCYGAWLHGDERGSVDVRHNAPGTPLLPPNEARRAIAHRALRQRSVTLDDTARAIVHNAVVDHAGIREWELLAINVRTNHVHAVVRCGADHPRTVVRQFKDWATRRLRTAGRIDGDAKVWTDGGSTRYLWTERSVASAVTYVHDGQGVDLPNPTPVREHRESGSSSSNGDHACHPSPVREHRENGDQRSPVARAHQNERS